MPLSAKQVRSQIAMLKPILANCSLKTLRKAQDRVGELMEAKYRKQVIVKQHTFERFEGAVVIPKDERRSGVILYLHGGGYCCGGLEYALGFGSMLAVQTGTRVFCAAYRLAPEHPYPAALEDALEAYRYLLSKGYSAAHITLCGESSGGGLCYALALKLREACEPMPCGILAISPWTDLTSSGPSYEENRNADPSMTEEALRFYAASYAADWKDPFVSPVFADPKGFPPSLIFVGSDEIMRSDAEVLHEKLLSSGCGSKLIIAPERWHGYLLYGLEDDRKDFFTIGKFLNAVMEPEQKLRWIRLDNAAKIYPAARRQRWSNLFRVSVSLSEPVDRAVLQEALDITARRFPSISVRLRRGVFWYYLEQLSSAPEIREEKSYPLTRMSREETRRCAFRVIAYENRIALEVFHSLTDGNGAMVFLKTLTAEYLHLCYDIRIPAEKGVLGRLEEPSAEELEDSFPKYAGPFNASRKESNAWRLFGTREPDGFYNLTCFQLSVQQVREKAHEYGISVTVFLCAVLMMAIQNLQEEKIPDLRRRKSIKIQIPINLRNIFPSKTIRNFALYTTPEIEPRLGRYSFEEICSAISHRMGLEITPKQLSTKIAANVNAERLLAVKLMPLFVKNLVMKMVFNSVGEKKSCLSLSNLGMVSLPEEMKPYVERMDFILGPQATAPHNCGVLSYGDTVYLNFIRTIRESELEQHFYEVLRSFGLSVRVESNHPCF